MNINGPIPGEYKPSISFCVVCLNGICSTSEAPFLKQIAAPVMNTITVRLIATMIAVLSLAGTSGSAVVVGKSSEDSLHRIRQCTAADNVLAKIQ